MYTYFFVSFVAGILWLVGLGYLLTNSLKKSASMVGALADIMSTFSKAIFIPTRIDNSTREVMIARLCLLDLLVFLVSFYLCIQSLLESYA